MASDASTTGVKDKRLPYSRTAESDLLLDPMLHAHLGPVSLDKLLWATVLAMNIHATVHLSQSSAHRLNFTACPVNGRPPFPQAVLHDRPPRQPIGKPLPSSSLIISLFEGMPCPLSVSVCFNNS